MKIVHADGLLARYCSQYGLDLQAELAAIHTRQRADLLRWRVLADSNRNDDLVRLRHEVQQLRLEIAHQVRSVITAELPEAVAYHLARHGGGRNGAAPTR